jgi:hypothetical protein
VAIGSYTTRSLHRRGAHLWDDRVMNPQATLILRQLCL